MVVEQVFEAWLFPEPLSALNDVNYPYAEGENITEGILNVDIVQGTDTYEGPQQQIDTGQFTIVTRNPAMDPKINPNLKYNSTIKFYDTRTGEFFRGYVTDVQVEYQRQDNPIITITGTDIFGAMQRVVIDQATHDAIMAESTGPTWNGLTFTEFLPYMYNFTSKYLDLDAIVPPGYPQPYGFWFESRNAFGELSLGNLGYSPAKYIPQVGETYLDVINKYAQTNLTSFSAKSTVGDPFSYNYINVANFAKYDPYYWNPQVDPLLSYTTYDFSSVPDDDKPYETILIDNGYNRVINQVDISNESRFVDAGQLESTTESFTRTSADSIEDYAISVTSVSTIYPEDGELPTSTWANRYTQNIFQVTAFPGQEIQQITFDNARYEDVQNESSYSNYALNQMIRIKHEIDDTETIDRVYEIAGITHNIAPDKWEMGFTLKPSRQDIVFTNQGSLPTLEMNATTGDTNFNFTATLVDFDPTTVAGVVWVLNGRIPDDITEIWPYATTGNMFKDGLIRTGFTQTWNFDDDGILEPYSFDSESTYQNPTDNRYGGYGEGNWTVYAFITLTNRFTVVLQQPLVVGTPEVEADFGWAQNLTNNFGAVTFTDTSVNNETGEVDSYLWDFGDGNTSNLQNPTHQYSPAPDETEYEVSLTVFAYGPGETKVPNTHTETVTLVQPEMTADYTFSVVGNDVTFTNTSINVGFEEPDAYLWDFGDGTISTEKSPFHVFPAPEDEELTFSVTLTIRNIWEQTESITKTVTIIAENATGSMPVRYIQLRKGTMYGLLPGEYGADEGYTVDGGSIISAPITNFKARTSKTKVDLAYLKKITKASYVNTFNVSSLPLTFQDFSLSNRSGYTVRQNRSLDSEFKLTIDLENPTNTINDIILDWAAPVWDGPTSFRGHLPIADVLYCEIEIWTTLQTGPLNSADDGTWFKIGSIEINKNELLAMDLTTPPSTLGTIPARPVSFIRPMPLNIPYFYYTITNHTVSFTSIETADSYLWTFGDGTTSTLKDPVKTFPRRGTYTVTLEVTNGGVVTRTTTEPVIIRSLVPVNTRYVKFVQNEHTGTYAFDTPTLRAFKAIKGPYQLPVALTANKYSLTDFQYEDYNMDICYAGNQTQTVIPNIAATSQYPEIPDYNVPNRIFSYPTQNWSGIRAKSLDASFRTSWSLIIDLQVAHEGIEDFTIGLRRDQITNGAPFPAATGITYSVYVTDVTSNTINPLTATWTKVGDFVPTSIPTGTISETTGNIIQQAQTYNIIPS